MTKINQLTQHQQQQLTPWRDQWLAHGLNTTPADRPRAQAGVQLAYKNAGLEPPQIFIWLDSPLAGCYGAAILANLPKDAQVWDQVWDQVRDQVRAQVGDQVNRSAWGQHDAWLSFYDYMHRVAAVTGAERIEGLTEIAQSAGWWWPFQGAVILTERPTELHRDVENRLHCETGPALRYPDGWSIWAWHGPRLKQQIVEWWMFDGSHTGLYGVINTRRADRDRLPSHGGHQLCLTSAYPAISPSSARKSLPTLRRQPAQRATKS